MHGDGVRDSLSWYESSYDSDNTCVVDQDGSILGVCHIDVLYGKSDYKPRM